MKQHTLLYPTLPTLPWPALVVVLILGAMLAGTPPAIAEATRVTLTNPALAVDDGSEAPGDVSYGRFVARGEHRSLSPRDMEAFFIRFAESAPGELANLWEHVGADVSPQAGIIAAPRLEGLALRRLVSLLPEDQLGMFLGKGAAEPGTKKARKERRKAVRALADDPALEANFNRIDDTWLDRLLVETAHRGLAYATPRGLVEVKMLIARNLFFTHREVNEETVRDEFRRLADLRHRFGTTPVFAEREVVLLASSQRVGQDREAVFGSSRTRRRLADQAHWLEAYGGDLPTATPQRIFQQLSGASSPTLVFSGHGRSQALKYGGGIDVDELARRLVTARGERGSADDTTWIVVILACRGHDFARNLLLALHRLDPDVPKPILVTPEEYGQNWVKLARWAEIPAAGGPAGDLVTLEGLARHWGPGTSVLVPGRDNLPRQIF